MRGALATTLSLFLAGTSAADWPQYRGDSSRSGFTAEPLPNRLQLAWSHRQAHKPTPAWPTSTRIQFDCASQPIVVDGTVYINSSSEDTLTALDLDTGQVR